MKKNMRIPNVIIVLYFEFEKFSNNVWLCDRLWDRSNLCDKIIFKGLMFVEYDITNVYHDYHLICIVKRHQGYSQISFLLVTCRPKFFYGMVAAAKISRSVNILWITWISSSLPSRFKVIIALHPFPSFYIYPQMGLNKNLVELGNVFLQFLDHLE